MANGFNVIANNVLTFCETIVYNSIHRQNLLYISHHIKRMEHLRQQLKTGKFRLLNPTKLD